MPVDHDIKDAGILAGFTRWGWPWHGLCEGGVIGSSGKIITQPATGNAWLIDKALPALDITPEEIASEALAGREWRNYALIPGGSVHGQALPANTYIHVDADGLNWMVTVSGSFPAVNSVRLQLSIVRFGHFQIGATLPTPVLKTVDVSCEDVELSWAGPGGTWYRFGRWVDLQDVWTNGARALLGVFMGTVPDVSQVAIFSAIELVLTGSGGADGSGLAVAASEVKPRSSLTTDGLYEGTNSSGTTGEFEVGTGAPSVSFVAYPYCPDPAVLCANGAYVQSLTGPFFWMFGVSATINGVAGGNSSSFIVRSFIKSATYARLCFYDSSGLVTASRLRVEFEQDCTPDSVPSISGSTADTIVWNDGSVTCGYTASWTVNLSGYSRRGWYLLHNDTVMDKLERTATMSGLQLWASSHGLAVGDGCMVSSGPSYTEINTDVAVTWSGSLGGSLAPTTQYAADDLSGMFQFFCDAQLVGHGISYFSDAVTKYGIRRTENAAAFFLINPLISYGTVATALGNKTAPTTASGSLHFSWQRKTGEFAFSGNPICYI